MEKKQNFLQYLAKSNAPLETIALAYRCPKTVTHQVVVHTDCTNNSNNNNIDPNIDRMNINTMMKQCNTVL